MAPHERHLGTTIKTRRQWLPQVCVAHQQVRHVPVHEVLRRVVDLGPALAPEAQEPGP